MSNSRATRPSKGRGTSKNNKATNKGTKTSKTSKVSQPVDDVAKMVAASKTAAMAPHA